MQIGCLGHICKIWGQRGYSNIYMYEERICILVFLLQTFGPALQMFLIIQYILDFFQHTIHT